MICSNIVPSDPTQRQFGDNDTHDDSSGSSGSITLSQNTEDRHTMISEITETALVPLSQITEMTEVDNIDPHTPLEANQTCPNTPTRRQQSSSAWNHVKRLRNHPKNEDGFTHVCCFPLEKDMNGNVKKSCNTYLISKRDRKRKEHPWHTTVAARHLRMHSESRFMHEKEIRKVAKILSIQDQLHDYGMANAKARLAIQSKQNHVTLDSGKNVIPYSNDFSEHLN